MFRIGGDYAVVTFTKPFIQNMSRHDVLEDKLTQTLWEEERIVDFSLNHSSSRLLLYTLSPQTAKHQYRTSPIQY